MLRLFPTIALLILIGPVVAGLAGILLPAFGYLPALGSEEFSLQPFRDLFAMPGLALSALLALWTGLTTTAIAFAIVVLFVAGWGSTRFFAALERLISPLLSVPHAAAAFGLAFLVAPSGFLFRFAAAAFGWERPPDLLIVQDRLGLTLIAALVLKEIPFLLLMTLAALPQARPAETERMMAALGFGRVLGFLHGVLPPLYRQIRLAVLAVLAFSTAVVDVALILGPTTPAPLAVRILDWQRDADLSQHFVAAAGAVLQATVTVAALFIWLVGERMVAAIGRSLGSGGWRARRDFFIRSISAVAMALCVAIVLAGIALLALWSVAALWRFPDILPQEFSTTAWMRLLKTLGMPLRDTLVIAAASSLIAVTLALGSLEHAARRGRMRSARTLGALYVPLLAPQIAFLFGLQILFSWLRVDGTFTAVVLVHLVFVFPYVLLSLSDPWWSWDPRYGAAVRALGHGHAFVFWRVRLPMLLRPVLVAAALGFAISVGLYLPTLLIGAGRWPTVTTETLALASGGDPRLVGATALVQALLPFLGFAVAALVSALLFRNRRQLRSGR